MNDDEFIAAMRIGPDFGAAVYGLDEAMQLELDREQEMLEALGNCKRAGASDNDLNTLAAALGLGSRWKAYARL